MDGQKIVIRAELETKGGIAWTSQVQTNLY